MAIESPTNGWVPLSTLNHPSPPATMEGMEPLIINSLLFAWSGYEPFLVAFILGGLFVALSIIEDKQLRRKPLSRFAAVCAVLVSLGSAAILAGIACIEWSRWQPR
jgi:hypothetical protein